MLIYERILLYEFPGEIFPAEHIFTIFEKCSRYYEKLKLLVEIVSTASLFMIALGYYNITSCFNMNSSKLKNCNCFEKITTN